MFGRKSGDYADKVSERVHAKLGIPKAEVARILEQDPLKREISTLKNHDVSIGIAYGAVAEGIADAMKRGEPLKSISSEYVAHQVYLTIARNNKYKAVAEEMLEEEVIEPSDLNKIIRNTNKKKEEAVRSAHVLENLLKKAAVILLLVGGVYYIFKSIPSITGGVIGSSASGNIIFGSVLFLFALAISHFYIKE